MEVKLLKNKNIGKVRTTVLGHGLIGLVDSVGGFWNGKVPNLVWKYRITHLIAHQLVLPIFRNIGGMDREWDRQPTLLLGKLFSGYSTITLLMIPYSARKHKDRNFDGIA